LFFAQLRSNSEEAPEVCDVTGKTASQMTAHCDGEEKRHESKTADNLVRSHNMAPVPPFSGGRRVAVQPANTTPAKPREQHSQEQDDDNCDFDFDNDIDFDTDLFASPPTSTPPTPCRDSLLMVPPTPPPRPNRFVFPHTNHTGDKSKSSSSCNWGSEEIAETGSGASVNQKYVSGFPRSNLSNNANYVDAAEIGGRSCAEVPPTPPPRPSLSRLRYDEVCAASTSTSTLRSPLANDSDHAKGSQTPPPQPPPRHPAMRRRSLTLDAPNSAKSLEAAREHSRMAMRIPTWPVTSPEEKANCLKKGARLGFLARLRQSFVRKRFSPQSPQSKKGYSPAELAELASQLQDGC
jgi:hypothetical protein